MRKALFILSIVLLSTCFSQESISPPLFQVNTGLMFSTRGGLPAGASLEYLYFRDKYHRIGARLEFMNVKHQKEEKYALNNSGSVIYGKKNFLMSLRPQFVLSNNLFIREKENGVEFNYKIAFGPSIGLVKPYFAEYYYETGNRIEPYDYSKNNLVATQGIFYGMNTAEVILGVNATIMADIELNPENSQILWGIEVGLLTEYYPRGVIIMPTESKSRFFPILFLNAYCGIRK